MKQKTKENLILIVPAYNAEIFLFDLFASLRDFVLCNIHDFFIYIYIVNDGSKDATLEKCNKLKSLFFSDLEIHLSILSKENGGLSSARNCGILESKKDKVFEGASVIFLDVDDVLLPINLKKNMNAEADLNVYLCAFSSEERPRPLVSNIYDVLSVRNPLVISQVLIKSNAVVLFDETRSSLEDWDFWIRVLLVNKATIQTHSRVLTIIRNNYYSMSSNLGRMRENRKAIGLLYKSIESLSPKDRKNFTLQSYFKSKLGVKDLLNIANTSCPWVFNRILLKAIKDYFVAERNRIQLNNKPFILTGNKIENNIGISQVLKTNVSELELAKESKSYVAISLDDQECDLSHLNDPAFFASNRLTYFQDGNCTFIVFKTWALSVLITNKGPFSKKDWLFAYKQISACDLINQGY